MSYKRKTRDVWEIQGNYGEGWECESTEMSWCEAREQLRCYRENSPYPVRAIRKRELLSENP